MWHYYEEDVCSPASIPLHHRDRRCTRNQKNMTFCLLVKLDFSSHRLCRLTDTCCPMMGYSVAYFSYNL
jgi:hypothetical protein